MFAELIFNSRALCIKTEKLCGEIVSRSRKARFQQKCMSGLKQVLLGLTLLKDGYVTDPISRNRIHRQRREANAVTEIFKIGGDRSPLSTPTDSPCWTLASVRLCV
jgi:hypothetical protein